MNPRMSLDAWMRFNSYRYLDGKRERTRAPLPDMLNTTEFLAGNFNGLVENERYWDKWTEEGRREDIEATKPIGIITCPECGELFKSKSPVAKYCSFVCREDAQRRARKKARDNGLDKRCFISRPFGQHTTKRPREDKGSWIEEYVKRRNLREP
jgi:hypothetical protein